MAKRKRQVAHDKKNDSNTAKRNRAEARSDLSVALEPSQSHESVEMPSAATSTSKSPSSMHVEAQTPSKPSQPFRFLDLPPELRNNVYEHFFEGSTTELVEATALTGLDDEWIFWHRESGRKSAVRGLPAILAVNKQIHTEAKDTFIETTEWTRCASRGMFELQMFMRAQRKALSQAKRICLKVGDVFPTCLTPNGNAVYCEKRFLSWLQPCLPNINAKTVRFEIVDNDGTVRLAHSRDYGVEEQVEHAGRSPRRIQLA